MPELAKNITINLAEKKIYIDGVEFPWLVAEDGPTIDHLPTASNGNLGRVSFPIFADHIEVIPEATT